jgi:hypothetical protein
MPKLGSSFLRPLFVLAFGCALSIGGEARAAAAGTLVVSIAGRVTDAAGSVWLSGQATIETTLLQDEFGGDPSIIYSIRLTDVTGGGFQASGEAVLIRPFASSDTVELPLTFAAQGSDGANSRTASATFTVKLHPKTGAPLNASAAFASPVLLAQ